ncbi:swr complex subunit [Malassezia japonica]|uniref:SWR1-complex protein 4 n=1 Tax=Malassezia japonica TaxID=223818 RepID=A0AAF0JAF4_9BASI|nr:swr complex subunit [Malassezia japonica]WFD39747.1 swr complex subunit [Malassezia japonica]
MSSNDVRDILSLPNRPAGDAGPSRAPVRAPPTLPGDARPKQRPEGMSRELYALLGPNAPSLVMSSGPNGALATLEGIENSGYSGQHAFQPKFVRKSNAAAVRKWTWAPFRNPSRSDTQQSESIAEPTQNGLVLHHWRPLAPTDEGDESEARLEEQWTPFNTASHVFHYSAEEYNQHLRDDDWTKDETDYLVEMCEAYDLRFIVIADRYEWPGKERSIEDLKSRYYTIARRLLRERISNEDLETRQAQLQTFAYDRNQEVERKKAVEKLFTRTPEQLAEEEALYVEARRLEQNEAKFSKERDDLLRLLGGWETLPNCTNRTVAATGAGLLWTPGQAEVDGDTKKRRKTDGGAGTPTGKAKADPKQALFDAQHFITRFTPNAPNVLRTPYPNLIGTPSALPPVAGAGVHTAQNTKAESNAHHGAYLRSMRMLTFRPNQYTRAIQALAELHPPIGSRLVYPTATNVEKWETLLGAVAGGLEMKKQLDRVEAEYKIAQARLEALSSGNPLPPPTEEVKQEAEPAAMSVDTPQPPALAP